jgi:hypothetical protein
VLPVDKAGNFKVLVDEDVARIEVGMAKGRIEQILVFYAGGNEVRC